MQNIVRYIEDLGYTVVFFNTPKGDGLIEHYELQKQAAELKAFTYCEGVKYVFVNKNLHAADRLYLLLHELGHIVLRHLDGNTILLEHNLRLDNEAEAFVFYALNNKKRRFATFL